MPTLRRAGTTSAAVLAGMVVALGLAHATAPEWAKRVGLDVWNVAEVTNHLRATCEESARLDEQAQRLRETIEAADHITTRLIDGKLSLERAIDLIEPLMRERPGFEFAAAVTAPAPRIRLKVARYLVERSRRSLLADPERLASFEARIEFEYGVMKQLLPEGFCE